MYTPFLRGRLFELQALQDLAFSPHIYEKEQVLPIIEPAIFTKACLKAYYKLVTMQSSFILVANPVATGISSTEVHTNLITGTLQGYENYYLGFVISQQTSVNQLKDFISKYPGKKISLIHYSLPGDADNILSFIKSNDNFYHHIIFEANQSKGYYLEIMKSTVKKIKLDDYFNKMPTNATYAGNVNEYFTNSHIQYKSLGYDGFGDFCMIGEKFEDGKGRPRAVVIHWTYLTDNGASIYINHFVSDEITGTENITGKFDQAYNKLRAFSKSDSLYINSLGHISISKFGEEGNMPQLGAIKKFSIMHHIELIRSTF